MLANFRRNNPRPARYKHPLNIETKESMIIIVDPKSMRPRATFFSDARSKNCTSCFQQPLSVAHISLCAYVAALITR